MNIPPFEDKPVVQDAGTSGTVLESIPVFCSFEPGVIALEPSEFLKLLGTGWPLVESRKDCYSLYIGEVRCDLRSYLSKLVYSSFYHRPEVQELVNPYQLPYQSGTFHVIILCDVFCQLRHPGTALDLKEALQEFLIELLIRFPGRVFANFSVIAARLSSLELEFHSICYF